MTGHIVQRRVFDDDGLDRIPQRGKDVDLKANGFVRANGIIPIEYNERLKAMARKQGKNTDQLIGELLMEMRPKLDQWEAAQEVERLRERFGDQWLDVLSNAL
jgi:hypothetical protein